MPVRVLDHRRRSANFVGKYPTDLKTRGELLVLGIEEGVRRHGLRVHAPGAFFIFWGCADIKRARRFRAGLFSRHL
ncbi:MAG: hypothetical protein CL566_02870 [Alphaproteobacteria bacterium]|nr:hypothetical protein [Alphaproteobacteria bacterium]